MTRPTWSACLAVLVAGAVLSAQTPDPAQLPVPALPPVQTPGAAQDQQLPPPVTFRAEVNYVEVDARVVDAKGGFVTGLTQGDFDVFEDGKPQKVATFSRVNIPVTLQPRPLFASAPIEPDVEDNLTGYDGRVYVLMLDDVHTNALRTQRTKATPRQYKSSPTARAVCWRRSTSSWAARSARPRWSGSTRKRAPATTGSRGIGFRTCSTPSGR